MIIKRPRIKLENEDWSPHIKSPVTVYIGSEIKNANSSGIGIIVESPDHKRPLEFYESNSSGKNKEVILTGIDIALSNLPDVEITIACASISAVNDLSNKKYEEWESRKWKTSSRKPVEYRGLWESISNSIRGRSEPTLFKSDSSSKLYKRAIEMAKYATQY